MVAVDLTGLRFGKLIAVEYLGKSKWKCLCECGHYKIAKASNLKAGVTWNCGCEKRKKKKVVWSGCQEDCFHCEYKDCLRPDYLCHETDHHKRRKE